MQFGHNGKINFKDKIEQIDKELKVWSKRKLTPFGRITVLKTIVISKLNHLFIALPNPTEELINNLQKKFFHFIWQSGTDRIKRDTQMQEYDKGGLKMINLKTYATISNAHLFRVCKWGKLSGSCLSTLNGFGSTQLPIFLCHIRVPTFSSQNN